MGHEICRIPARFGQHKGKLVPAETRGSICVATADRKYVGQPAKGLTAGQMAVAVVNFFQSVQVKQEQRKLPLRALGSLDLAVEHVYQLAVVRKTRQRILGRLLTEMIFQLTLFCDVFGYYLVTVELPFAAADFPSAEADLQARAVPSLPVDFDRIGFQFSGGVTQQLFSLARIRDDVTCEVDLKELLS